MVKLYSPEEGKHSYLLKRRFWLIYYPNQSQDRLPLKMSTLIETVSKKPIPPHQKAVIVEVMVSDEDGEDVEVR